MVRLTWMSTLTLFVSQIRAVLLRPRVRRSIEAVTGGMLLIFGLHILTAKR